MSPPSYSVKEGQQVGGRFDKVLLVYQVLQGALVMTGSLRSLGGCVMNIAVITDTMLNSPQNPKV